MTTERKTERWIDDLVGALFDPIIVMPGGWGDDLPEWLGTRVKLECLAENIVALREGRERADRYRCRIGLISLYRLARRTDGK